MGRLVFYSVLRAGHLISGRDYKKVHPNYPGHKLLLCLRGSGFVRVNGRDWAVNQGDLAWIFNDNENAHWPVDGSPWEMLWIRVVGPHLEEIYRVMTTVGSPVFTGINARKTESSFKRVFKILDTRPIAMEAAIHAEVAQILKLLFEARHDANPTAQSEIPQSLRKPLEAMRLRFNEQLTVEELAQMAAMSVSSFHRQFKAATGTSPIDWLKRERINQARKRLLETDLTIAEIADQTGYYDQFYFSKDFKRMTKLSPTEYRQRERLQKKYARLPEQ
ncbi:MAG: helix-turn-helix domain-containing protein [Limisphaerales bacterium]